MASLDAGVDLLLLPGGPELTDIAMRIAARARTDDGFAARLSEAADRVRHAAAPRSSVDSVRDQEDHHDDSDTEQ
jgi:hypothetical protein